MTGELTTDTGLSLPARSAPPKRLRARSISLSFMVHTAFFCGLIALGRQENPASPSLVLDLTVAFENAVAGNRQALPAAPGAESQPAPTRPAAATSDKSHEGRSALPPIPTPRPPKPTLKQNAISEVATPPPRQRTPERQPVTTVRPVVSERPVLHTAAAIPEKTVQAPPDRGTAAAKHALPDGTAAAERQAKGVDQEKGGTVSGEKAYLHYNFNRIRSLVMRNLSFPAAARRMGLSGRVLVQFTVLEDGGVTNVSIVTSSGHDNLDANVVSAIHRSTPFPKPPASARLILPIAYRLK